MRIGPKLLVVTALAAGCATTPKRDARPRELIEFDPVLITGRVDAAEIASLNEEELFALGTSSFAAKDFGKAEACFSRLADEFPRSRKAPRAAFNAGLSLMRLGRFGDAAARLTPLSDPMGTGDALDAAFKLAECLYQTTDWAGAIAILGTIAERKDLPATDRLQAHVQQGVCMLENRQPEAAEKKFREALNFWAAHKEEHRLDDYFPAQAQFFMGEIYRLYFEDVALDPDLGEKKLGENLEYKCEMLLSAQAHFLRAIRIGDPRWGTAAGFRIGALYEALYDAMVHSKAPSDLDADQVELYREELKKKIRVLVTKAMSVYERTLAAAERVGVDSPFITKTRESLDRMKALLLEPSQAPSL